MWSGSKTIQREAVIGAAGTAKLMNVFKTKTMEIGVLGQLQLIRKSRCQILCQRPPARRARPIMVPTYFPFGSLLPRPPPDGLPVVLGAFSRVANMVLLLLKTRCRDVSAARVLPHYTGSKSGTTVSVSYGT